jgi:thiamine kinase-like enzyme
MPTTLGGKHTMPLNFSSIPLFREKTVSNPVLLSQQGLSNENYSFYVDKKRYLLRKFKLKDRDRALEYEVQSLAYQHALAAKPLHLDLEKSFMVCEYVEGKHKINLSKADITLFSQQLQILHSLKIDQRSLDIKAEFSVITKELEEAFALIDTTPFEKVLCHNDLNPLNCIFFKEGLKLIDWEFAGMNDRYFDLASVAVEFSLDKDDEIYFMNLYFANEKWDQRKLNAYKVIYKALCKQWFENNM